MAQAKEAGGALVGVGATFSKAISAKAGKGAAAGTETERGMMGAEPALAESKTQSKNFKVKVLKENKK